MSYHTTTLSTGLKAPCMHEGVVSAKVTVDVESTTEEAVQLQNFLFVMLHRQLACLLLSCSLIFSNGQRMYICGGKRFEERRGNKEALALTSSR